MERLLAILNRRETAASVLSVAALLQARLPGARLDLLRPRSAVDPSFMPTEEMWTEKRRQMFETEQDAVLAGLQSEMAAWPGSGPVPVLRQVVGEVGKSVASAAAAADLVVLGGAGRDHAPEAVEALRAALFDAVTAVLLAPRVVPRVLGERIAVAWERSEAADEAVSAALPLLLGARAITVLVAREGHDRAVLPARLLQALEAAGVATTISRFGLEGQDIGAALLSEARRAGADLMVMGAFTHSRTLEALFGGATREVLAGTDMPLLLHH